MVNSMLRWDDRVYLQFSAFRTRAAADLLARIPVDRVTRVVDLGCGPGNSTELLVARWPDAYHVGVDPSAEMLERAAAAVPRVKWVQSDIASYRPERPVDVIFANAVLHWLGDHEVLVPALYGVLEPRGALAIQMSGALGEPSHQLMAQVAAEFGVQEVAGVRPLLAPEAYYDMLAGADSVDIWKTDYYQAMPDENAILRWVTSAGLRPYLAAIPPAARTDFLSRYTTEITRAYPRRADGRRLLKVPQLFVVATKR